MRGREPLNPRAARRPAPDAEGEVQPDWLDALALIIAAFQILLPVLLAMLGAVGLLVWLLYRMAG